MLLYKRPYIDKREPLKQLINEDTNFLTSESFIFEVIFNQQSFSSIPSVFVSTDYSSAKSEGWHIDVDVIVRIDLCNACQTCPPRSSSSPSSPSASSSIMLSSGQRESFRYFYSDPRLHYVRLFLCQGLCPPLSVSSSPSPA